MAQESGRYTYNSYAKAYDPYHSNDQIKKQVSECCEDILKYIQNHPVDPDNEKEFEEYRLELKIIKTLKYISEELNRNTEHIDEILRLSVSTHDDIMEIKHNMIDTLEE